MSSHRKKHWPSDWKTEKLPKSPTQRELKRLAQWMKAMTDWGQNLRDDLIRLEGGLGLSTGDPGDPPPPPWGDNEE